MPTVEKLVDSAVEAATSQALGGPEAYARLARDLLAATSSQPVPPGPGALLAPLSDAVAPKHRRLVAWALMRYLAARSSFPSEPRSLRPRALAFIQEQIAPDLEAHRVNFDAQSHELESRLSQVVPRIERALAEAAGFRDFTSLTDFRESLLATVNHNHNSGLLYAFANRSLVNEAIRNSLGAAAAFQDALEANVIDAYERAKETCGDAHDELEQDGTAYAQIIASAIRTINEELDRKFASLELAQPATLSLTPVAKKYPLHATDANLDIRLALQNSGGGTALDVRISVAGTDELAITRSELQIGTLSPGESRMLRVPARVTRPESIALLSVTIDWLNFDRRPASRKVDLELAAQDPSIDWTALAEARPYALDVALGDRFVGRSSLLASLLRQVSSPNPGSLYLWGQKRVGKTSLVRALADAIEEVSDDFAVVYLETIREVTAEQTTNGMCRRLISRLKETDSRFSELAEPEYTGTLSPLNDFLDQLLAIAPEKQFLLVVDEFDELPTELYKGRGIADTFFQTLGKGIAGKRGVGVVIVGGERIPAIIRAQGMRLNMYRAVKIDYFERNGEFGELVRKPSSPLEFSDDAVARLWHYSAGNPYFLNEICGRLLDVMIERRDAHITTDEVHDAVTRTIGAIEGNSFAHYWADGIVDVDEEQTKAARTERIRFLVAAAGCLREGGEVFLKQGLVERAGELGCAVDSVEGMLRDFQNRGIVVETEPGYRFRVRLFEEWLRGRGAVELSTELWDDLGNRERIEHERAALITGDELDEVVTKWGQYQGETISTFMVRQWLGQFGSPEDQRLMFTVLKGVRFYRDDMVRKNFTQVHRSVAAGLVRRIVTGREHRRDIVVSCLGPLGHSGPEMVRKYRQANTIWDGNCVAAGDIGDRLRADASIRAVVFADDFIGTGRSAIRHFREFVEHDVETVEHIREHNIRVWYAVVAGTRSGINDVIQSLANAPIEVSVVAGDELGPEAKAFDASAPMWVDERERRLAEEIATSFGRRLEGRAPLGLGNTQGLVVFETNCPNTSLPILYRRKRAFDTAFQPLFPRSS